MFLPEWFPSKMPWVHRGVLALRTNNPKFLLDFGEEWWPEDTRAGKPSHWTVADLVKIITNFVVETKPAVVQGGIEITPAEYAPMFKLTMDGDAIVDIHIVQSSLLNAYIMPRGYSKTTLLNAANLADVCYAEAKFLLYVSESGPHAQRQLATVRNQLENNELLRLVFGNLVPDRQSSLKWTDPVIETTNGQRVGAIGKGGSIRGMSKDAVRPTRIVLDDLQDEDAANSDTQREHDMDWFVRTLLPARQMFGEKLTIVDFIGSYLGPDTLLDVVMQDEDWSRVWFGAKDKQDDPLWSYAFDDAKLEKLRNSYAKKGKLAAFEFEYMSRRIQAEGSNLRVDKIIYVNRPDDWFVAKALVIDPAISKNPKADFVAFACGGMGQNGKIHLLDFHAEVGMEAYDQAEKYFEMHFAHMHGLPPEQLRHGVEAIAYQRALISIISAKQHEKSQTWGQRAFFEVIPIMHGKTAKKMRIQGILGPRMRAGHLSHERRFPVLEQQLTDWSPNGKAKDDGPDAEAMMIQLLDPFVSLAANDDADDALPQPVKGLPPLRKVLGNWRKAP